MMRITAAACLVVLLVGPLLSRIDDNFSCVKEPLYANHCFDREHCIWYWYINDPSAGASSRRLHTVALA
jgi:hypothetical protein